MSEPYYLGVLSGTSMDAVDVALVSFQSSDSKSAASNPNNTIYPRIIKTLSYPIPEAFRNHCLMLCQSGKGSIDDYGKLDAEAGEIFAQAVNQILRKNNIPAKKIRAIGSHGQTLRHRPEANPPFSLQIGDPNIIAERTGIPTIADFRRRDIAAGGQGAPLAPAFHAAVFGSPIENRVIVNIGGISNITILHQDKHIPLIGFDTGPGNCLMDLWVKKHWKTAFDKDGLIAAAGTIQTDLLQNLMQDPFFSKALPKSTGRDYFNEVWLLEHLQRWSELTNTNISNQDVQATLLSLTAQTLANAILQYAPEKAAVYICGGGVHNTFLIQTLNQLLARPIDSTETLGSPPDWIEAILFAWLAKQTLEGKSGNCPTVTGARHAIPLGGIFGYEFSSSFREKEEPQPQVVSALGLRTT
jgi:anhydro-N-acetylmuramic acid kinase